MSIFQHRIREVITIEPPDIPGSEAIRQRVRSRRRYGHLGRMATDHQIALPALEKFADGGALPEAAVHALVKEFYPHHTRWDPVADKLISTAPPPTPTCTAPPDAYDPAKDPNVTAFDRNAPTMTIEPVQGNQQPAPVKRAGFEN